LLEKSCTQFGATLVSGRAGTGKTTVAASFSARYNSIAWYSVDSADSDWNVFSHYFNAALMKTDNFGQSADVSIFETDDESPQEEVSRFVSDLFSQVPDNNGNSPLLIVLDDIQHLFDTDWFSDFFTLLLHSLMPQTHLLMLCRSRPPLPLWRLRSKQRLNVIDEKLLAFSPDEAERLYRGHGLSGEIAKKVHRDSFGRASKLAAVINSAGSDSSRKSRPDM
jgi:LuxR family maltose regulon positive regulatory protein